MWKCSYCGKRDDIRPVGLDVKFGEDKTIKEYDFYYYECRNCEQVEYELEELATWEE